MKNKWIVGMMILGLTGLVGCQQTTDNGVKDQVKNELQNETENNVKSEMPDTQAEQDTNTTPEEAVNAENTDTIEHIFANAEEVMKNKYKNLRLKKKLELVQPTQCGMVKFQVVKDFDEKADMIFKKYLGENYNTQYVSEPERTSPKGPDYNDPNTGRHLGIGENGFVLYDTNGEDTLEDEETVFLGNGYDESKEYALKDGTITLKEAIERGQNILNDWKQTLGNNNVYIPYRLTEKTVTKTKQTVLELQYQVSFGEIGASNLSFQKNGEVIESGYTPVILRILSMQEEDYSLYISQQYEAPVLEEAYDKILTLDAALQSVSKSIISNQVYDVQGIALEYMLENAGRVETQDIRAGQIYSAAPYWVVYLDETMQTYATVNALTGETNMVQE